nr:hypothetical protein [Tanacetum cinerariifolium]
MSASRQGMRFEEIEQVVAQRVANAIVAITIYESKIRIAHDSMNQVVREEATIGKNVSNRKKRGSDHGRDSDQQQSKRIEVVRAHATGVGGDGYDKKETKSKRNRTKPSTKQKAWRSQQLKVNKKSNPTKSKPKKPKSQKKPKLRNCQFTKMYKERVKFDKLLKIKFKGAFLPTP